MNSRGVIAEAAALVGQLDADRAGEVAAVDLRLLRLRQSGRFGVLIRALVDVLEAHAASQSNPD